MLQVPDNSEIDSRLHSPVNNITTKLPHSALRSCSAPAPYSTPPASCTTPVQNISSILSEEMGTDPTGCLGNCAEFTEVSIFMVPQPQERSTILLYRFKLDRCLNWQYLARWFELSKLPIGSQSVWDSMWYDWKNTLPALLHVLYCCGLEPPPLIPTSLQSYG